jgi:lysozyme
VRRISLSAIALALIALLAPAGAGAPGPSEARAATVCGAGTPIRGIDVSRHQGPIDWTAVAASGVRFGIARIANGTTITDYYFEANYRGMRANGITPGSYIFWQPGHDPVAQGNIVAAALARAGFDIGDIPPTIDVEVTGAQPAETIAARLRITVSTIQKAIGVTPMIYASPKFWEETLKGPNFSDVPLWIAHWGVGCPSIPSTWPSWSFWQTSSTGSVPGIVGPVDMDQTTGPTLPVYAGGPVIPMLPDINVHGEVATPVTYDARAIGYRGIGMAPKCNPASGSLFKVGTTTVVCTAQNALGATARSFQVTVRPPTPPRFVGAFPDDVVIDAGSASASRVTWAPVTARDFSGALIPVRCSPGPGSEFPVEDSLVICRATDAVGQQVAGSFMVSVTRRFEGLLRR